MLKTALQATDPISDSEILHYLKNNMRAGLQLALIDKDINSISRLVQDCTALEDLWQRLGYNPEQFLTTNSRYRVHEYEYQSHQKSVMDKDNITDSDASHDVSALRVPIHKQNTNMGSQYTLPTTKNKWEGHKSNTTSKTQEQRKTLSSSTEAQCWNCKNTGHFYRTCRSLERHVFCYGCGENGIFKPDCLRCSDRQGNLEAKKRVIREPLLQSNQIPEASRSFEEAATNTDPDLRRGSKP